MFAYEMIVWYPTNTRQFNRSGQLKKVQNYILFKPHCSENEMSVRRQRFHTLLKTACIALWFLRENSLD